MTDTSIRIRSDTRDKLRALKVGGETYSDVIERLIKRPKPEEEDD